MDGATATARFRLAAGQAALFALGHGQMSDPPVAPWTTAEISDRLDDTAEGWRSWSAIHQNYEGPWRELVAHSGRVLQALTFAPTGAIVAAPTTSLPETVGGERNWDYRYTWVRDASLTMEALWVAACPDEANKFFTFLADAAASQLQRGADLQIMFGIGGERDLTERELPHLAGWRGSRPVRVGNGAWTQRQLDVYGELLGAAQRLIDQLGELDPVTQQFLATAADTAAASWREKDQGIWEIRGEPRDFLYSKLMCWVALDRAIALAGHLGAEDRVTALGHHPRRDPGGHPGPGLERASRGLHPGVRQRGPRRVEPDAGHHRVPARGRPADESHHRRHRAAAHRPARAGLPVPGQRRPGRPRRVPSWSARSGWPRPRPWQARSTRPP